MSKIVITLAMILLIINVLQYNQNLLSPTLSITKSKAISSSSSSSLSSSSSSLSSSSLSSIDQWNPFNNSNPHQSSWCPTATCQNSPICTPCNRRHLFIFSTARSGSTTLLSMFNTLPYTRISGENHNTFGVASLIEDNLLNHRPQLLKHPMDKYNGPFRHNTIPKGSLACITQQLHYTMNPPPLHIQQDKSYAHNIQSSSYDEYTILGFKEVRLHSFTTPSIAANFYRNHFPCSRFIINVQYNITHQLESYQRTFTKNGTLVLMMKKKSNTTRSNDTTDNDTTTTTTTTTTTNINTTTTTTYHNSTTNITDNDHHQSDKNNNQYNGPSEDDLTKIRDFHLQVGTLLGEDYAKVIHFDQWKDDVSILNEVIHWLGYKNCNFNAIVHENDNGYGVDSSTIIDLGKNCHYPFINE